MFSSVTSVEMPEAPDRSLIELVADDGTTSVRAAVDTDAGGRIAQVTIERDDDTADLLARPPAGTTAWSSGWGSFAMAPWAGRIRHGRFRFLDDDVRLEVNHGDGTGTGGGPIHPPVSIPDGPVDGQHRLRHSIHGTTFFRTWTIDVLGHERVELHCPLGGALGWPYGGVARQVIEVSTSGMVFSLCVEATDAVFPATAGWHPWFTKPTRLEWTPLAMYEQDDIGLPTGRLVTPPAGPWDDCFVARGPAVLHYDRAIAPQVTVTSDCDHLVVFDRLDHATCVEPQSGPPDAPTVRPHLVAPGHPLRHTMTWTW